MSSSIPKLRFLLDENVRIELGKWLQAQQFDVKTLPKGTADKMLCSISLKEERLLVTNDTDFSLLPRGKVFAVVWLRVPQKEVDMLVNCFQKCLSECKEFKGHLILIEPKGWRSFPLAEVWTIKKKKSS